MRTPACHDLMVRVEVLHVFTLDDHTIAWVSIKLSRKQARWTMLGLGPMGCRRGRCRLSRSCASRVQHVSLRAAHIKTVIGKFSTDPEPLGRRIETYVLLMLEAFSNGGDMAEDLSRFKMIADASFLFCVTAT